MFFFLNKCFINLVQTLNTVKFLLRGVLGIRLDSDLKSFLPQTTSDMLLIFQGSVSTHFQQNSEIMYGRVW